MRTQISETVPSRNHCLEGFVAQIIIKQFSTAYDAGTAEPTYWLLNAATLSPQPLSLLPAHLRQKFVALVLGWYGPEIIQ